MKQFLDAFFQGYSGYFNYLVNEITHPSWQNYFYWLTGISLFFFSLELIRPWRKEQPKFRKDFWLDAFYMYFNYFLFSLIIFSGLSKVGILAFEQFIGIFGFKNIVAIQLGSLPVYGQILILFVVSDFIQWWTHRLLHRVSWLWEFHKVHHSIEQMGFAGHLRYHWMENIVYKLTQFIPLSMIGYDIEKLFVLYMFTTVVGHFNHSNITINGRISAAVFGVFIGWIMATSAFGVNIFSDPGLGEQFGIIIACALLFSVFLSPVMKYIFNSPEMHIWHHAWDLPVGKSYGINFGLTLGIWDWIFGTAYWPFDGRDIRLGFPGLAAFPKKLFPQLFFGFKKKK